MFYYIRGTVAVNEPNLVVIDAGGVGYAISTSLTSCASVRTGETATFYTHLHVREDIFEIYGFSSREELACFKQLINISGVGPKAALAILGVCTPSKLALSVVTGDEKALTAAPGVGKKLAQRIILELKDKMSQEQLTSAGGDFTMPAAAVPGASAELNDALAALTALGYSTAQAQTALKGQDLTGMSADEIIRLALKKLF